MLFRIHRWYQYAKVQRSGHLWMANTYAFWAEDFCGTYEQARRAIQRLKAKGLIKVEIHKWYKHGKGRPWPHIRPVGVVDSAKSDSVDQPNHGSGTSAECNDLAPQPSHEQQGSKQGSKQETKQSISKLTEVSPSEGLPEERNKKLVDLACLPGGTDDSEILEAVESGESTLEELKKQASHIKSVQGLAGLWKKGWAAVRDDYCSWSATDPTRLSAFRKNLPEDPGLAILFALENWHLFSARVKKDKCQPMPNKPQVSRMLQHRDVLLDLMDEYSTDTHCGVDI